MQWTVPQLSEQEFDIEADLNIINLKSYPSVGGTWKVKFTTNGTADLIITAINGTTFGTESPDDLKFLELNNGTHTLTPVVDGNTITYYNFSSSGESFEESEVLTPFKHVFEIPIWKQNGICTKLSICSKWTRSNSFVWYPRCSWFSKRSR